ncbi:methionine ABC transporter ATP-binding protein [Paenibacillus pinihumi]|uniref:methionine ABC transporter ATP-binding protein n=1 Tax=Paenibacillus pinihumi TaxID=669462 RepID=UPI0004053EC8|nr:methionine ABC transporter ATP-binding protein [Paenibacillus pinihumi]
MITFQGVSKVFRSKEHITKAVDQVTLTVNKGDIYGVIGFSGAGKSTLLRLVNLLETPTEGKVIINSQEISSLSQKELRQLRRRIGMIFQNFNLFNSRTVYGNIAYPLKLAGASKQEVKARVTEMLQFVGLEDKADHYPEQLSGGQKQRVGIARALATSPDILICDEATSALDPETTGEILKLLKKVNEELNITIMLITHEMHVIRSICDRVAVMENGTVIEEGSVFELFAHPKTQTTKNFINVVQNDKLSPKLLALLRANYPGQLVRLIFKGGVTGEPVLSQFAKLFNIDFNIIYGSINELQGQLFGSLIVEIKGDEQEIQRALESLKKKVEVREVINHES